MLATVEYCVGVSVRRIVLMVIAGVLALARTADAGSVDCRNAPHQIGDLLAVYKMTKSGKPVQSMNVDTLRISASGAPKTTLGWLFLDQYGNRWIHVNGPNRLHLNGGSQLQPALRMTGASVYLPAQTTLAVPDMVLERCDRVSAP
jgi:hypothetical protein